MTICRVFLFSAIFLLAASVVSYATPKIELCAASDDVSGGLTDGESCVASDEVSGESTDGESSRTATSLPSRGLCAHRGGAASGPENTIPALRAAANSTAGQIEFDVRVSRDGELVVMHDPTVDRTTDGSGAVRDLTLAEIKRLDAGSPFVEQTQIAASKTGEQFLGADVPTFAEALAVMPRDVWINVHYNGNDEALPEVVRTIVAQDRLNQAFLAASQEQIQIARSVEPSILTCNMSRQGSDSAAYVDLTLKLKCEFIQLVAGVYTQEDVARLKAAGARINCFGTNDADEIRRMWREGIDFPLTDRLDLLALLNETNFDEQVVVAEPSRSPTSNDERAEAVAAQARRAWNVAWAKFYSPQTQLFYDFIESYEPGRELDHLPTQDEVDRLYPNPCGYGTAMEDCAISGGILLTALVDRFITTGDELLRSKARDVFSGLERLATVSGSPGFVARGVSPRAIRSCYINGSRDQVTHLALAVWEYWRSPLSDDETKARAATILFAIADRMTRNVVPENDFDFLCSDGSRCRIGICRMANVDDHEAARLPAIYAVAWDVAKRSGDVEKTNEYWERWRRWEKECVEQSEHLRVNEDLKRRVATYALLQMEESLDVLWRLEADPELSAALKETLKLAANIAKSRQIRALQTLQSLDLTQVAPSWREAGGLVGAYRKIWYAPRECGEIALTAATDEANSDSFDSETARVLTDALLTPNFDKISTCGVFHLIGAYEKARRRGFLTRF